MPFKPGQPRPEGAGRKAGVDYSKKKYIPNVREQLEKLGIDLIQEIVKLLPELEPKDRFSALMALLPYAEAKYGPKLVPAEVKADPIADLPDEELAKLIADASKTPASTPDVQNTSLI
jgi:hypothetical protein